MAGCEKTEQISLTKDNTFPTNIQIFGPTEICPGDSVLLEVDFGQNSNMNCDTTSYSNGSCLATMIVGTGSSINSSTSYPAPYGNFYWGVKHQILFTATELNALGFYGGKISSIFFDVAQIGTVGFNNFEIKMGCTSANDLSMGWETGLVTVLPGYTHNPTLGWNEHLFANPYNWDGVSNLIVEVCFHNSSFSSGGTSLTYYTPTSFTSVRYYRADNANVCSSISTTGTSSNRPNIKFGYCSVINQNGFTYNWSPAGVMDSSNIPDPKVFPFSSTIFTVIVADSNGFCKDTITHALTAVRKFNAGFTSNSPYCVDDMIDTLLPINSGGIFSGAGVLNNGVFNPNSSGVGFWPIYYNTNSGNICTNDSIIIIEVKELPDATIEEVEVCYNSSPINLVANTPGGIWSGFGITDSILGTFNPAGMILGYHTVYYKVTTSCTNYDTALIRIIPPYDFSFTNTLSVCSDDSLDLSTSYTLSTYINQGSGPVLEVWWDVNGYVSPSGVFDATGVPPGSYPVVLEITGIDGSCGYPQVIYVTVNPTAYAFMPFSSAYCSSQTNAVLFVRPWLFGPSLSFTQTPLGSLLPSETLAITPYGQNGVFDATLRGVGSWEIEFTYGNSGGCQGISKDTIYVLPSPLSSVTNNGITISAVATGGYTYQWYDCDAGSTPIVSATNQSYTPGREGRFKVVISAGTCHVTSSCEETWPLSVANIVTDLGVSIYPNPVQNELRIDRGNNDELTIEITDNTGKVVFQKVSTSQITLVEMGKLASGIYIVKMVNANGTTIEKVVKK